MMKREFVILIAVIIAVAAGYLSYTSTLVRWSGGRERGVVEVVVRNGSGQNFAGVKVDVRDANGALSYGYPFDNFKSGVVLKTDRMGRVALVKSEIRPRGGMGWRLFWLFPIGFSGERFDVCLTAPDGRECRCPMSTLIRSSRITSSTKVKVAGGELEIPVYTNYFTLIADD